MVLVVYRINSFSFSFNNSFQSWVSICIQLNNECIWRRFLEPQDIRPPRFCGLCTSYGRRKPDKPALHSHEGAPVFKTASAIYFSHARVSQTLLIWLGAPAGITLSCRSSFFNQGCLFFLRGHNAPLRLLYNRARGLAATGLRTLNEKPRISANSLETFDYCNIDARFFSFCRDFFLWL